LPAEFIEYLLRFWRPVFVACEIGAQQIPSERSKRTARISPLFAEV
jgi:hypothetical protein